MRIDLNADLGEGMGDDEALLQVVTSANIATGAHAGGGEVLRLAVARAVAHGVAIGAHPSYRDVAGFGRRSRLGEVRSSRAHRADLVADLRGQIMTVAAEAERHGARLAHVKAHGALYNEAVADEVAAGVLLEAILGAVELLGHTLAVLTQPGGHHARMAAEAGLRVVAEGFVDRAYSQGGGLVPRSHPGAVLADVGAMVDQALALAAGQLRTGDGGTLRLRVDSLCVHGDTPRAVQAARSVRAALEARGWRLPGADSSAAPERTGGAGIRCSALGDRAFLVEPESATDEHRADTAWVLRTASAARRVWGDASVVPGLRSVLVAFAGPDQRPADRVLARRALEDAVMTVQDPGGGGRTVTIPVRYHGPDLADVAATLDVAVGEVVQRHQSAAWTVSAIGFSPGFAYLTSPDPLFASVPRRPEPRSRVPAGSLALAAGMCAVYPSATPGGWQLIGSSEHVLFDARANPPAALVPGDRVDFRAEA